MPKLVILSRKANFIFILEKKNAQLSPLRNNVFNIFEGTVILYANRPATTGHALNQTSVVVISVGRALIVMCRVNVMDIRIAKMSSILTFVWNVRITHR